MGDYLKQLLLFFLLITSLAFSQSVYITKTGKKFHTSDCSYLKSSKIEISLNDAIGRGYSPCSRCNPDKTNMYESDLRKIKVYVGNDKTEVANSSSFSFVMPAHSLDEQIISHYAYCLSYDEEYEQAKWVAYTITTDKTDVKVKRTNNFKPDPLVKTGSADNLDYKGSGFDRGHLCPAADMSWSPQAMDESFYYSNMSPQGPSFNRGIWKTLEEQVRVWLSRDDTLSIVVGPVLSPGLKKIGHNGVSVPEYYYKVILDYSEPEIKEIAFLMPNQKCNDDIFNYAVPVDSIEKVTGIDFFPNIPDTLEQRLEKQFSLEKWK